MLAKDLEHPARFLIPGDNNGYRTLGTRDCGDTIDVLRIEPLPDENGNPPCNLGTVPGDLEVIPVSSSELVAYLNSHIAK